MFRISNLGSKFVVGCGLVFAMIAACGGAQAAGFKVLHVFGGTGDGSSPQAGLLRDKSGNLYGTTTSGGAYGYGTIFKIAAGGAETVLYSFTGGDDGSGPDSRLTIDSSGNLYGTTPNGGAYGCGVIFELIPAGLQVAYILGGNAGCNAEGGVIRDSAGNLYGTTSAGGTSNNGAVFELPIAGALTTLHSFTYSDGSYPFAGVIRDNTGNLYGTTEVGGAYGYGTVFKLAPNGTETVLYSFTGGSDGRLPRAGLVKDKSGNFYGTTVEGGAQGQGAVFKLAANGTETVLHSFAGGNDGDSPSGGLYRDALGNLYGTTFSGGPNEWGVVFKVAPDGTETVVHAFTSFNSGVAPNTTLIADKKGHLYGTATAGGKHNGGTVFKLPE